MIRTAADTALAAHRTPRTAHSRTGAERRWDLDPRTGGRIRYFAPEAHFTIHDP